MTKDQFDKCPKCGAFPQFGLRCHPKWSVKVGTFLPESDMGMVAYYAHDESSARDLHTILKSNQYCEILAVDHWNDDIAVWQEVGPW